MTKIEPINEGALREELQSQPTPQPRPLKAIVPIVAPPPTAIVEPEVPRKRFSIAVLVTVFIIVTALTYVLVSFVQTGYVKIGGFSTRSVTTKTQQQTISLEKGTVLFDLPTTGWTIESTSRIITLRLDDANTDAEVTMYYHPTITDEERYSSLVDFYELDFQRTDKDSATYKPGYLAFLWTEESDLNRNAILYGKGSGTALVLRASSSDKTSWDTAVLPMFNELVTSLAF